MRLRLLLPRGGGGRGVGGLSRFAALAAALALAWLAAGCGGSGGSADHEFSESRSRAPVPAADGFAGGGDAASLAVGITEPNPAFVWPDGHDVQPPFAAWRDELARMRPSLYRLVIEWPALQPEPGAQLDLDVVHDGCGRSGPPCAAWNGLREQLRALAARQQADPGAWSALAVIDGTPGWAGRDVPGCTDKAGEERARQLAPEAAGALGDLAERVLEVAREEGAALSYWSARNEPNHPSFAYPQRERCAEDAASLAVEPYARAVTALAAGLDRAPGDQRHVLGELAGIDSLSPRTTSVLEFVSQLPRDVVCSSPIWSQHGYVGGAEAVDQARRALDDFRCERQHEIWITETGVGGALVGRDRAATGAEARRDCRRLHAQLADWHNDPRVTVAVQYTLREDDLFPVGLVDSALEQAYPALDVWQAWGSAEREPGDPAPARPSCTA